MNAAIRFPLNTVARWEMSGEKYLFKRRGSQNWYVRIQNCFNNNRYYKSFEKSLGTSDKDLARIKADEIIFQHQLVLYSNKQGRSGRYIHTHMYEKNRIIKSPDGTTIVTDDNMAAIYDAGGALIERRPNTKIIGYNSDLESEKDRKLLDRFHKSKSQGTITYSDIIADWIEESSINGRSSRDARHAFQQFDQFIGGKRLSDCTRSDAKSFVKHLISSGAKTATVSKKLSLLRAACNIGLDNDKLKINPFIRILVKGDDSIKRKPLTSLDMKKVRDNFDIFNPHDLLLWFWLSTTGMRLGEAFQIQEEFEEEGCRFVRIGTKTRSSQRRVPIPQTVIDFGQSPITGSLFQGRSATASARLLGILRRLEISYDNENKTGDMGKVIHSLRHRAADRLRASGCPLNIQYELLGHEIVTVASGYGVGSPVTLLKTWIDKIGN